MEEVEADMEAVEVDMMIMEVEEAVMEEDMKIKDMEEEAEALLLLPLLPQWVEVLREVVSWTKSKREKN